MITEDPRQPVGYCEGPDGAGTKLVPVFSFTDEQLQYKAVKDRITSLRKEADELERGLEPCTHPVVKDEAGWTYATRRCLICGGSELV